VGRELANQLFYGCRTHRQRRRFAASTARHEPPQKTDNNRMTDHPYELLDFGDGRKLERFGDMVLNRPCPTAEGVAKMRPELWETITARFRGPRFGDGSWSPGTALPEGWPLTFPLDITPTDASRDATHRWEDALSITFQLELLPSGQIGIFPEQYENWQWISRQVAKAQAAIGRAAKVLNLFAYTGGSTLAASAAGAEVVHIDAVQTIVDRARENAALSGLAERPVRWIAEDAVKFCRRELKRGNRYDAVILDPPSYGHGPKGEPWKIDSDLLPLLKICGELTADSRAFVLVSCHSPGIGPAELSAYLAEGIFGHCGEPAAAGELALKTSDGRKLPAGVFARWPA
jgi:23S rRNA (cytosine1962-C5)-methyltransferase